MVKLYQCAPDDGEIRVIFGMTRAQRIYGKGFHYYKEGCPPKLNVDSSLWNSFAKGLTDLQTQRNRRSFLVLCLAIPFFAGFFFLVRYGDTCDRNPDCTVENWLLTCFALCLVIPFCIIYFGERQPYLQWQVAIKRLVQETAPQFEQQGYRAELVPDANCVGIKEYVSFVFTGKRSMTPPISKMAITQNAQQQRFASDFESMESAHNSKQPQASDFEPLEASFVSMERGPDIKQPLHSDLDSILDSGLDTGHQLITTDYESLSDDSASEINHPVAPHQPLTQDLE